MRTEQNKNNNMFEKYYFVKVTWVSFYSKLRN